MEVLRTLASGDQIKAMNELRTWEKPLFLASDVDLFLGLTDVQASNFNDEAQAPLSPLTTPGDSEQVTFLTAHNLYELLGSSQDEAAGPYRKWVGDVIESIRTTGRYDIEDYLCNCYINLRRG